MTCAHIARLKFMFIDLFEKVEKYGQEVDERVMLGDSLPFDDFRLLAAFVGVMLLYLPMLAEKRFLDRDE